MKTAFITGITGQDGSYLSEFLLEKEYKVYGLVRRASTNNLWRINHILKDIEIVDGDLLDESSILRAIDLIKPNEIYNLAAQSFVGASFSQPILTSEVTGIGALRILEAIRLCSPNSKFYQASSSEMLFLKSPYAISKLYAHKMTQFYREAYGIFCVSGTLFNHESPRRGEEFVTRKISKAVAGIKSGSVDFLYLGDLEARRDWGWAPDYAKAMWMMLQGEDPMDYTIATGESHSIKEFCEIAFKSVDLNWRDHVISSSSQFRVLDIKDMVGVPTLPGWAPSINFTELVETMVKEDLKNYENSAIK